MGADIANLTNNIEMIFKTENLVSNALWHNLQIKSPEPIKLWQDQQN